MSEKIVQCRGCLTKLRVRKVPPSGVITCPRCDESIKVADAEPESPPAELTPSSPRRVSPRPEQESSFQSKLERSSERRSQTHSSRQSAPASAQTPSTAAWDSDNQHDVAAEARRARLESIVFVAVLLVMLVAAVGGAWAGLAWWTGDGDATIADAADPAAVVAEQPGTAPAQAAPPALTPPATADVNSSQVTNDSAAAPADKTTPPDDTFAATPGKSVPPPAGSEGTDTPPAALPQPATFAGVPIEQGPAAGAAAEGFTVPREPPALQPVAPPGNEPVVAGARRIKYRWTPGAEHVYQLQVTAGQNGNQTTVIGVCSYRVKGDVDPGQSEEAGSGTGFVVGTDGVIATCAHVVEGARTIDVDLNGKSWSARVIATDPKTDIALLQIDAQNLAPLPIGDSDSLEPAEAIQVIGFPLSDVLGESVKVTSGTVAGLVNDARRGKRIQVDAAINPGNSGGPVVDEHGHVVGVASAKLAGTAITSVGFVSPSSNIISLMASQGLAVQRAAGDAVLSGPDVARNVIPGTAYIRVRGAAGGQQYSVGFNASFTESESFDRGRMRSGIIPVAPSHTSDSGEFLVNAFGDVQEFTGDEQLPFVLGPAGLLFIERLDAWSESAWEWQEESMLRRIKRTEGNNRFVPPGFGSRPGSRMRRPSFGLPGFDPFDPFGKNKPDEEVIEEIPAIETVSWKAGPELNQRISLTKTYEFSTTRNPDRPYMRIRGRGTMVFDVKVGMPQQMDYSATMETNDEDGRSTTPLRLTWTLRDPAELAREREAARQRMEDIKRQREQERTVPNSELVDELLAEVRAAEGGNNASRPLGRLSQIAVVEERRRRVLEVAGNHLENSNGFVRKSATEAYCHWATAEDAAKLVEILQSGDSLLTEARKAAARTLVSLHDPAHYAVLVDAMQDHAIRRDVRLALQQAGPSVEPVILERFTATSDGSVRRELLEVLQNVGTSASIPLLKELASGTDVSIRHSAQRALDAVRSRL